MCIEDLIEILKHTGQAVTNLARLPVQLIAGDNKKADEALDWVLLVPLEFASNVLEMKGISNMDDYETKDIRRLLPNTLFSIEPGIYLPGRFGIRSEVNMMVMHRGTGMTGRKQETLLALLAE